MLCYALGCVQIRDIVFFHGVLATINRGNRNRQVQQLLHAGTLAQDNAVLINTAIWDSFQVCCVVFHSDSISFFHIKIQMFSSTAYASVLMFEIFG